MGSALAIGARRALESATPQPDVFPARSDTYGMLDIPALVLETVNLILLNHFAVRVPKLSCTFGGRDICRMVSPTGPSTPKPSHSPLHPYTANPLTDGEVCLVPSPNSS